MSSYIEQLEHDRERMQRALQGLIAQQEARLEELGQALAVATEILDRLVVRTMVFRSTFGSGTQEQMLAETDAEEASKPVTETTRQMERETQVLDAYRHALERI